MTEAEWLACNDPATMNHGPAFKWWAAADPIVRLDARRTRLLAVACAGLLIDRLSFPGVREALAVFERHADGGSDREALRAARLVTERCLADCDRRTPMTPAANWPGGYPPERQAALVLREAGRTSPLVPIGQRWGYWDWLGTHRETAAALIRDIVGNPFHPVTFLPEWRTITTVALANLMYESRDFSAMPILADALEDANCSDEAILAHCRGDGPHVRGCWVCDLVLGKE